MQQPFKRGVEFDGIVAGIHASDPEARVYRTTSRRPSRIVR